jgi:3-hydroxyacyl-CoA dehydrogenase
MGRGLGHVLARGGHSVTIVDREPEEAARLAEEVRGAAGRGGAWRGARRRDGRGGVAGRWGAVRS